MKTRSDQELAAIRHELRTPANHVIGYAEMLLEDDAVPESYQGDLRKILRSGRRLLKLMGSYFDEADKLGEEERSRLLHDLRTPVNHIVGYAEMLQEEAAGKGEEQIADDLAKIGCSAEQWLHLMEGHLLHGSPSDEEDASSAVRTAPLVDLLATTDEAIGHHSHASETGAILIVDDDALNRDLLERRLRQSGHETTTCGDGDTALEVLREREFDLVLLDMLIPGRNGAEVLTEMKKDPALAEVPVIIISALDDQAGIANCIDLGAEDYLRKPFNPAVLRARIGTSIERRRLRESERKHLALIEEEKQKSEALLLNILPRSIAERLKAGEQVIADQFQEVSVLFADLVGFTPYSADHRPEEVVGMLNRVFSSFDVIADQHGLEKIKTIGDSYMVVSGVPKPREDHAHALAGFALDLVAELERLSREQDAGISIRVGIDSGPVVAGVIGRNKFSYDLWGHTVNMASRMESHGIPGKIQVTARTSALLEDEFDLHRRGEIDVKGKGRMKTYFLEDKL